MSNWTKHKLEHLITDKVEESLTLDYKRADSLNKNDDKKKFEITKDVVAFANSSGGVLIYGIAEPNDKAKRHLPERLDPVNRSEISKEWIEQIIQTIQPKIDGVVIEPVSIDEPQNLVCYVVEVPKSNTAHQARDHIYYKRHNFNNLPMEDYEIRDVMNRKTYPVLKVSAKFAIYPRPNSEKKDGALVFEILNDSDVFARFVKLLVKVPPVVGGRYIRFSDAIYDQDEDGYSYRLGYSNHLGSPLFPRSLLRHLFKFNFVFPAVPEREIHLKDFKYEVFADAMPKQSGLFKYEDILLKAH